MVAFGKVFYVKQTPPPVQAVNASLLNGVTCDSRGLLCSAVGNDDNNPLSYSSTDGGNVWALSTMLPPAQGGSANVLTGVS